MWHLADHLTACLASDRLILLDAKRDRYFALPSERTPATLEWLQACDGSAAPAFLTKLLADGADEPLTNTLQSEVVLPEPADHTSRANPDLRSILTVTSAVALTRIALRTQCLGAILKRRRLRRLKSAQVCAELGHRARNFVAARRWCPIGRNCLLDSLAIDHWLGSPPGVQLVFGVIAHPFEAHCWIQSSDEVLNDSYDRVSRFEPILSVWTSTLMS